MRFFLYSGLLLSVLFLSADFSYAQSFDSLPEIEISINLLPEFPQANQKITATVTSTGGNTRAATIFWLLEDEIKQQKPGGESFEFTTGNIGSVQKLSVLIKTPSGEVFTKSVLITPAEVTLLWEADTFVPPFYKGRALYSSGSRIRAEAIASFINEKGVAYDSSELIYTWSKNGTVLGSLSGLGANTLLTEGPKFFGDYVLAVTVTSPEGTKKAQSASRVQTLDPFVILYEKNPLVGILYNAAITDNYVFSDSSQLEVQAVPYFMDTKHENSPNLLYSWKVNGKKVVNSTNLPSTLTIQLSPDDNISTSIGIDVAHTRHLLQTAKAVFRVTFTGSARNSLFGL